MRHLLVTNDFPPRVGGIQAYLWELWRRLDPSCYSVMTASSHPDAAEFDRAQSEIGIHIERIPGSVMLPLPGTIRRIRAEIRATGADYVILDPAVPLGVAGPKLGVPYGVILHGAEVTVPGRLPVSRSALVRALKGATFAICAGGYPEAEARRLMGSDMPMVVQIPPGVDVDRFTPLEEAARMKARARLGLPPEGPMILSVSRLVPRKGMDVLIKAVAAVADAYPEATLVIGGSGRDAGRLDRLAQEASRRAGIKVMMLGRVDDADLPDLYGSADLFSMLCRNRWGGLEQEGFGIVFLEAAAAGVPQIAGRSGGATEAVDDGVTGLVLDDPTSVDQAARAIRRVLSDDSFRERACHAARQRAVESFSYHHLAHRLSTALGSVESL